MNNDTNKGIYERINNLEKQLKKIYNELQSIKKTIKTDKTDKYIQDTVIIFTDGSCKGKKIIKCGYGVHFQDGKVNDISKPFTEKLKPYTNQRAELYAIYAGIKKVIDMYTFNKLLIKSDSMYSIKCITEWISNWKKNGWKTTANEPVKNMDILKKIDKYMTKYGKKIKFEHVSAHVGIVGNEKADKLANDGADMS